MVVIVDVDSSALDRAEQSDDDVTGHGSGFKGSLRHIGPPIDRLERHDPITTGIEDRPGLFHRDETVRERVDPSGAVLLGQFTGFIRDLDPGALPQLDRCLVRDAGWIVRDVERPILT